MYEYRKGTRLASGTILLCLCLDWGVSHRESVHGSARKGGLARLTLQHAHTSLFGNSAEEVKPEFPFLAGRANIVPRSNNLYCTNKAVYFALVLRGVTQWESSFRRAGIQPTLARCVCLGFTGNLASRATQ